MGDFLWNNAKSKWAAGWSQVMGQWKHWPQTLGFSSIIHAQGDVVVLTAEILMVQVYVWLCVGNSCFVGRINCFIWNNVIHVVGRVWCIPHHQLMIYVYIITSDTQYCRRNQVIGLLYQVRGINNQVLGASYWVFGGKTKFSVWYTE